MKLTQKIIYLFLASFFLFVFLFLVLLNKITDTQLAYNTGQHLTTTSSPTFASLTLNTQPGLQLSPYNTVSGSTSELRFLELAANGTNYVGFKAPDSITTSTIWTLPSSEGTSGYVLKTNGSGQLYWGAVEGGSGGIGTVTYVGSGSGLTGGPITESGTLSIDLLSSNTTTSTTSSYSGLEFVGANNQLSLIRGCGANQVLAWNDTNKTWECTTTEGIGGVTGTGTAGYVAYWTGTSSLSAEATLAPSRGGTGLDASSAANGTLPIGTGSGFTLATLTEGEGINITNGSGSITIDAELASGTNKGVASFNTTNFVVTSGDVNTIQDITTSSSPTFASLILNTQPGLRLSPYNTTSGSTSELRFLELAANGTNYVGFKAPDSITTSTIWTLPSSDGGSDYVLTTNGAGVLSWQDVVSVGGAGDITGVGSMTSGSVFADSTASGQWLGLGSSAGRIEFDDQATDEINVLDAYLGIGTNAPSYELTLHGDFAILEGGQVLNITLFFKEATSR